MSAPDQIGVSLSGGGHRATVFGLGALLALADAGVNKQTTSISSVSGGSIANGIVMVGPDYSTSSSSAFETHIAPALRAISQRGVLGTTGKPLAWLTQSSPATRGYLRLLIASLVVELIGWVTALALAIAQLWVGMAIALVVAVVAGIMAWRLLGQRSVRTERAVDAELLGAVHTTLADQQARGSSVHHVICTTELQTGTSMFFSNRAVYGHQFGGTTKPVQLPLSTAVQASACVPGAFAPRVIKRSAIGLDGDGSIVVVDGGVYDNMADEWEYGYDGRTWAGLATAQPRGVDTLIVVNGSAGWDRLKPVKTSRLALEMAGLMRSKDVQYDVSTAHRRRALFSRFTSADAHSRLDGGAFVQISRSPYEALARFGERDGATADDKARVAKAVAYLDGNGYSPAWWDSTVATTAGVKTTLAALGADTTALLLEHGYILTLVCVYAMLDCGSLDRPLDRTRFARLAVGDAS